VAVSTALGIGCGGRAGAAWLVEHLRQAAAGAVCWGRRRGREAVARGALCYLG
jgi:hypothetical protein